MANNSNSSQGSALDRFKQTGGSDEQDPIERLRFFCSLAMNGQDWLDVEPFFDAITASFNFQLDIINEQRRSIGALNMCVGGEGSCTTDNLVRVGRLEANIEELTQTNELLQAEMVMLKQDAERYRWLRNANVNVAEVNISHKEGVWKYYTHEMLDASIDSAIATRKDK